jgi:hypothetical protein
MIILFPCGPLAGPSEQRDTKPVGQQVVWNVPYVRNPFFTGREDLLTQLESTLHTGQPMALSQPQAISGLGGIGKTQIAVEYAYRHRQDYQAVLWAQAQNQETLLSSYGEIGRVLGLPVREEQDQTVMLQAVKGWLQTQLVNSSTECFSLNEPFLSVKQVRSTSVPDMCSEYLEASVQ